MINLMHRLSGSTPARRPQNWSRTIDLSQNLDQTRNSTAPWKRAEADEWCFAPPRRWFVARLGRPSPLRARFAAQLRSRRRRGDRMSGSGDERSVDSTLLAGVAAVRAGDGMEWWSVMTLVSALCLLACVDGWEWGLGLVRVMKPSGLQTRVSDLQPFSDDTSLGCLTQPIRPRLPSAPPPHRS